MAFCFFDLETTDANPDTCRIVQGSFLRSDRLDQPLTFVVNPGVPIEPGAREAHGYSDDDVKDLPGFENVAQYVEAAVARATLVGYNCRRFDTPILHRELKRVGRKGLMADGFGEITHPEIDLLLSWRKLEPRTLTGALARFGVDAGEWGAHDAWEDVRVLPDLMELMKKVLAATERDLRTLSRPEDEVDRDGKFKYENERIVITFGKHQGTPIDRVPNDYLRWMLGGDFSESTKAVIKRHIGGAL